MLLQRSARHAASDGIDWAMVAGIPVGYNADIQIKRPGAPSFVNWMLDQTGSTTSAPFVPDAGIGVYKFRARLQQGTSDTIVSGFSPA